MMITYAISCDKCGKDHPDRWVRTASKTRIYSYIRNDGWFVVGKGCTICPRCVENLQTFAEIREARK